MNSVFSLDDLSESLWSPPPGMNRSQSEWAFEKFLEEVSASAVESSTATTVPAAAAAAPTQTPDEAASPASSVRVASQSSTSKGEESSGEVVEIGRSHPAPQNPMDLPRKAPVDSQQYHAYLKNQLDLACAAVALTRVPTPCSLEGSAGNPAVFEPYQSQSPEPSQLVSHSDAKVAGEANGGTVGMSAVQKSSGVQGRQTTSESSREDSDDDEVEGGNDISENMDPADIKRARRMLSNRESARRSRRRKQEQMNELETQVGQLKAEHSTLLRRLTDVNHKYDEAAVDNRILKADIETLRAKVKMAEETVKRVTGVNPLLLAMTKVPSLSMPYVNTVMDTSAGSSLQLQQGCNQFSQQPLPTIATAAPHPQRLDNSLTSNPPSSSSVSLIGNALNDVGNRVSGMSSIQNVAGAEQVQNCIPTRANSVAGWDSGLSHGVAKNKE